MSITKCKSCGASLQPGAAECDYCHSAIEPEPAPSAASANASGPSAPQAVRLPAGWVRTSDSWAGFSVGHPSQWTASCERGSITASQDLKGTVQAFVWPVPLRAPMAPQQIAHEYYMCAKSQNHDLQAFLAPPTDESPNQIKMRITNRVAGQQVAGMVTIDVFGNWALASGYHGPQHSGEIRELNTLNTISRSFRPELPLPRQPFREPGQGSYDALFPAGWMAEGRLRTRLKQMMVTCEYFVRKDNDGLTQVAVPGEFWRSADGPLVGLFLGGLMGMQSFTPAAKFGVDMLPRYFKGQSQQHIDGVIECPEVLPRFRGDISRLDLPSESAETTAACVISHHVVKGVRMKQKSFFATARPRKDARWKTGFAGLWIAELMSYYHAPESEFRAVEPILAGVADSFAINYEWVARHRAEMRQADMLMGSMLAQQVQQSNRMVQQNFARTQAHIAANQRHVSDGIMASEAYKNHVYDVASHNFSNATLGRTDVIDPSTDTVYNISNNHPYHWLTNSGTIVSSDVNTNNDVNMRELLPFKY